MASDAAIKAGPRLRNKRIATIRVSDIEDAPWNFRTHPESQRHALKGAIDELGFYGYPDVYETASGALRLCDGHLRKDLLISMYGPDAEIEVNVTDFDESEAKKATLTKDPLAAMAEADGAKLDSLLREIDTGSEALQKMLAELADDAGLYKTPDVTEDDVPEPPADPVTKPGDLWLLGEHRLLCGDSTKAESWSALGVNGDGGLCFTSPPYNLWESQRLSGNVRAAARGNAYIGHDDSRDDASWADAVSDVFLLAIENCEAVVFNVQPLAGNRLALFDWLAKCGNFRDIITWDKGHAQPAMANGVLDSRFEWLCVFGRGKQSRKIPLSSWRGTVQNVYSAPGQRGNEFASVHAATFPVHLPAWGMSTLCNLAKWCVDPYCGSGTTLIAAEQLGRRCYGIEISPSYCDVIVQRWEKLTGRKAELCKDSANCSAA